MSKVQVIEQDGKRLFYVVPADIWDRVRDMVEDAEDAAAYADAVANDDGTRLPLAVAKAMAIGGTHPVKAWREHRKMTLTALAKASGFSTPYLSQIEAGKRIGSASALKKIAAALKVPVASILP